ncbi:hypothetical protein R1flu_029099 [Riccia fluitans]|uniref:Uncharacterized protein n=1 Tax=Riccia fluitans TaxID=41844 RepID=A0ABD1XRJ5_9MARC
MESCPSPTFDQRIFEVTTTLHEADGEDRTERRKRNRRSLGRRVSFAEAPAYHIFARDDEYVSPSHEKKNAPQVEVSDRLPGSESNILLMSNLNEARMGTRSISDLDQKSFSPSVASSSWHPAINISPVTGDDGESSGFIATPDTSSRQKKDRIPDEDVTLDSTAFLLQLQRGKSLPGEDTLVETPNLVDRNKELVGRRDSSDEDMSMWIPTDLPITRAKTLNAPAGSNGTSSDMSITMQVQRKRNPSLGIDFKETSIAEQDQKVTKDMFSLQEINQKELDRDQNLTKDLLSLQELVQGEEDDDMVAEMQLETAVIPKMPVVFNPGRTATNPGSSYPGTNCRSSEEDCNALVEEVFQGKDPDPDKEELGSDRSITMGIPSLNDVIGEEEDDQFYAQKKMVSENVMLPSPQYSKENIPRFDGDISGSITAQAPVPSPQEIIPKDRDQDQNVTKDVPSLQELVEEDDDTVVDMQLETEVISKLPVVFDPRSATKARGNTTGGNINAEFPRSNDLPAADFYSPYIPSEGDRSRRRSSILALAQSPLAATSSVEADIVAKVSATPLSDSSMEIDDRGEGTLHLGKGSTVEENNNQLMSPPLETLCAISNGNSPVVDTSLRSSCVALPPSSLVLASLVTTEADLSASPFDSSMELVDSGEIASSRGEPKFPLMKSSSSETICAGENVDSKHLDFSRLSSSINPENVTSTSGSGSSMDGFGRVPQSILHSKSVSLGRTSYQEKVEIPTGRFEEMDMALESSPTPRKHDEQELISSVPRNSARLLHSKSASLGRTSYEDKVEIPTGRSEEMDMALESSPTRRTHDAQEPISSVLRNSARLLHSKSASLERTSYQDNVEIPTGRSEEMDMALESSPTRRTHDTQELISSVLRNSIRLTTKRAATLDHNVTNTQGREGSKKSRFDGAETGSSQEAEASSSQSEAQRSLYTERFIDGANVPGNSLSTRNISVGEFLKLAQVEFSPEAGKSSPLVTNSSSLRACDVRDKINAFRYLLFIRPQVHICPVCRISFFLLCSLRYIWKRASILFLADMLFRIRSLRMHAVF